MRRRVDSPNDGGDLSVDARARHRGGQARGRSACRPLPRRHVHGRDADRCRRPRAALRRPRSRPVPARLPPAISFLQARRVRNRASTTATTTSRCSSPRTRARATAAAERRRADAAVLWAHAARRRAGGARRIRSPVAEEVALALPEADQVAALATHPRIGEPSEEQRGAEPEVLDELARLNDEYERRFGFEFVVFVDGRTRAELLPVLRERLERTRDEELETGLRELCAIAREPGGRGLPERPRRPRAADAARRRRDRLDRRLVLLHPARPRPGAAEGAEGGRRGRVLGCPRRRLLPLAEVQGRPADSCRSTCTGSSGRHTRPGSRASRSSSSSTGSTPTRGSSTRPSPTSARWQAVALSAAGLALAWLVYDLACRVLIEDRLVAVAVIALVRCLGLRGRASSSPHGRRSSRSARCSGRSWPRTSSS